MPSLVNSRLGFLFYYYLEPPSHFNVQKTTMKEILKSGALVVCICIALLLGYANYRLYDRPKMRLHGEAVQTLRALKYPMHTDAPHQMQALYPEGFVFMHAIYALSWCDAVQSANSSDSVRQEAQAEVVFALKALESKAALQVFNADLPLPYGAYYRGWTAYAQGQYIARFGTSSDSMITKAYQRNCADIAAAIRLHHTSWLDSYSGMAWPGDNIVCLAALTLHDQLFVPAFTTESASWLQRIQQSLDPATGLIPHYTDGATGAMREGARGSSQALILSFLPQISPEFSKEQYQLFRKHFLTWRMGLPGIREYPEVYAGEGDIDSGPLIWGIGGVATIVGHRAATLHDDCRVSVPLWATLEGVLCSNSAQKEKNYLFGSLPMIDVFMAWSQAAPHAQDCWSAPPRFWRLTFQGISLGILLLMAGLVRWLWKR
jgi:hypothetical protein